MPVLEKENVLDTESLYRSHLSLIGEIVNFIGRRYHLSPDETEEFASTVHLKIISDNYAVFEKFKGESSIKTYLDVVVHHQFLDYRDKLWGKWRPSTLAQRLGPVAIDLERLVTRDGYGVQEAIALLRENHGVALSEEALVALYAKLPQRLPRTFLDEEYLANVSVEGEGQDERLIREQSRRDKQRLNQVLAEAEGELTSEFRMIIRLRFRENLPVSQIARTLGTDQKVLYRTIGKILKQLKNSLEDKGIMEKDVQKLLG